MQTEGHDLCQRNDQRHQVPQQIIILRRKISDGHNKELQKAIGFDGQAMTAHITMSSDDLEPADKKQEEPVAVSSGMDVLTTIKTRQSIRKFTSRPVEEDPL